MGGEELAHLGSTRIYSIFAEPRLDQPEFSNKYKASQMVG